MFRGSVDKVDDVEVGARVEKIHKGQKVKIIELFPLVLVEI